jgi:photosystem II stability/assembly factor-like uncharacterized protein
MTISKSFTVICVLAFVLLAGAMPAQGQLFVENFEYTPATSLNGQGGWSAHSGAGTNPPQITTGGLSYTGYPGSGVGNAASFTTTGEDVNRPFASFPDGIASGSLYYSLLVRLDSVAANGDYFFHLNKGATTFTARIFARRAANGNIRFGLGRSSTVANINYSDSIYTVGTTYLLVMKYTVIDGPTNDTIALWIDPALMSPEPAPTVLQSAADRATADLDTVYGVALRQGTAANAPIGTIDAIRVGRTWDEVVLGIQPPLTGTKTIPGDYPTLAAAITALNTLGVGTGGVTFNVASSHTETAPDTGYVITATGTAANPIVFQKNPLSGPEGSNPTFTASASLTAGALNDAIIKIIGGDYITIDGFTLQENPANTVTTAASNNMTEFGVGLFYATPTNGAQNNTIKNCTITLNRIYQNTFGIYSNVRHTATAVTVAADITDPSGSNSNLKIYNNSISNVNTGICVVGSLLGANMDTGLDIGGGGAGNAGTLGNTISDYGTTGTFSAYVSVSGSVNGIYINNQLNSNVSNNTIASSVGGVTVTGTVRGIYSQTTGTLQTTGSFTRSFSNNNISIKPGNAANIILGIANEGGNSTLSLTINNNDFNNTGHTVAGTGATTFISNTGATLNQTINNNTFTNLSINSTGSVTFIVNSVTLPTGGTQSVNGNSIVTAFAKTLAGGTITFFSSNASSPNGTTVSNNNNNFSNITVTGATTIAGWTQSDGASSTNGPTKTVTGNTFSNITGGTSAITGMTVNFSGANTLVSNTAINNISSAGAISGLVLGASNQSITASSNIINTLASTGASTVTGLSISGGAGTVNTVYKNKVYDLQANNAAGVVNGVTIASGATNNVYNNLIGDLRAPSTSSTTDAIRGINITSATAPSNVNISYNSIYLNSTSTGTNFSSSGIFHTTSATATTAALNMRNNVIVNSSTPNGTGTTSAYRRSSTTLTNYGSTSNNNLFYAGVPGAGRVIFFDGTNADQTLAAFKTRVTPRETQSVTENPPFLSTTGADATFLHINPATPTRLESGGVPIAGITEDYDGDPRHVSFPDIGADEFAGIAIDENPPVISYTPLGNTGVTSARTLTANVVDPSGAPTSGVGLPAAYWRINSGTYTGAQGVHVSGSQYSFTFGAGVAQGDTVSYYIAAQDNATPPNVAVQPSAGAAGLTANPPAASTPPTNPSSSLITAAPLAGDYTVGVSVFNRAAGRNLLHETRTRKAMREIQVPVTNTGKESGSRDLDALTADGFRTEWVEVDEEYFVLTENSMPYTGATKVDITPAMRIALGLPENVMAAYPTITAAVADLNLRGVGGHTSFVLVDTTYPSETYPITIDIANVSQPSQTALVTFKPAAGVAATVSGSSTSSIFKLNGADYITFDGLNSGGSSLTVMNTNTATSTAVIWIGSKSASDGATNNTVRNSTIRGSGGLLTAVAILVGSGTTFGGGAEAPNSNTTIINNTINNSQNAVFSFGNATMLDDNMWIAWNNFGSTDITQKHGFRGILISNAQNSTVANNMIKGVRSSTTSTATMTGIQLSGTLNNVRIESNNISDIKQVNTTGWGANGIFGAVTAGTNIVIANNFVYDVAADGFALVTQADNGYGIMIHTGMGYNVYHNSVYMTTNQVKTTGIPAALNVATGITAPGTLNIRNNLFVNGQTVGTFCYAALISSSNTVFAALDYNDYFASDSASGRLGLFGTTVINDLAAWRTATGQDANSISADPLYTDTTNLHIDPLSGSPAGRAGIGIAAVTTDIDGDPRHPTMPDMGADEFTPMTFEGIYTIGTGGTYANLKAFFDDINANTLTGNVIGHIISDIGETATAVLNPISRSAEGGPYTITIRPVGGAWKDTANIAGPMIDLNGPSYVTFDGDIGGVNSLTLRNSGTGTTASVIRLINDATHNTVKNCILEGAGTSVTTGGVITFGTSASGTTGNSNNTIAGNDIRDLSTTGVRPSACIASNGTATAANRSNTITNNNIFNFLTNGINVSATGNGGGWVISGNSFYYNNPTVPSAAQTALNFNPGAVSGDGNTIYGNYVGGQAPLAGGGPWTNSGNVQIAGIIVTVDTVNTSTVRKNTIQNIFKSGTGAGGVFPMAIVNGSVVVDSNTIGGLGTLARPLPIPIHRVTVDRNQQAHDGFVGAGADISMDVLPAHTLAETTPAEIETSGPSTEPTVEFVVNEPFSIINAGTGVTTGIQNQSAAAVTINDNQVSHLFNSLIGSASGARGINNGGTAASRTAILRNHVHTIASYTTGTLTAPAAAAITWFPAGFTGPGNEVTQNTGHAISARDSGAVASNALGMLLTNYSAVTSQNHVYDISNASTGTSTTAPPTATGFYMRAMAAGSMVANNMSSVGNAQNSNTVFAAFWNGSGTNNTGALYYNSGLVTGTAASGALSSYGFLRGNHSTTSVFTALTLRNNIFVNERTGGTGKHYGIGNQGTRPDSNWTAATSDYNIFNSADAATIGLWGTMDQTLAQWQTTSGGDAQTLAGDPGFISVTDLHIDPASQLPSNNAIPIAAVTVDFDGEPRSPTTPDRGADEYTAVSPGPLLFEDFESGVFPPAGWSAYIVTGDSGWRASAALPLSGTTSAFNRYNPPASPPGSKFLVTKRVNIPSASSVYELSFWIRRVFTGVFPPDTVYVKLSTTDSLPSSFGPAIYKCYTGANADTATDPNIYPSTHYRKFTTSITGYSGPLFIAFDHQDDDGQSLYLEDVKLDLQTDVHDIGVINLAAASEPPRPASAMEPSRSILNRTEKSLAESQTSETAGAPEKSGIQLPAMQKHETGIQLDLVNSGPTVMEGTDVVFRAIVHNFGTFEESSYQVGWSINGVPQTPVSNTRPLPPAGRDTLMLTWATPTPGVHAARAWSILATDTNPSNDSSNTYIFEILAPNVLLSEGFNVGAIPPYPAGWHTKNRDGGPATPSWFLGTSSSPFPPFEGSGFIGSNFQRNNGLYIDRWLVTPNVAGGGESIVVDSLTFWQRSPSGQVPPNFWPDSIQVLVSTTDTAASSFTIVLDYFRADTVGWRRKAYALPNAPNRYVAFRYLHYDGGPSGNNSNYVGIDDIKVVRHTAPAQGAWAAQTSGFTTALYSTKAVSGTVGWAAGASGRVLRTTNGGANWTNVGGGVIGTNALYNIFARDQNFALTTTSTTTTTFIYRTTDGGANWTQVYSQSGGFINAIHMFDAMNGIAQGDPVGGTWTVIRTSDGGATWSRIATEPTPGASEAGWNNSMMVIGNTIWWGTNSSRIWRSTDGGATWTNHAVPFTNGYGIWFNDPMNGIVVGNGAARTTDGGVTWNAITVTGAGDMFAVGGVAPDYWIARGTAIHRSNDNGSTWAQEYAGSGSQYHVSFVESQLAAHGWTVSSNGSIAKFSPPTSVGGEPEQLPEAFALMQNYPNPFNPTTTIQYALPTDAYVTLAVYNILGQKVAVLRDEIQNAGFHNVAWSGRNEFGAQVASGVYFYRIEARPVDGSTHFTHLKKMLLLK